jgi:mono/diheme cytochrome c family protein
VSEERGVRSTLFGLVLLSIAFAGAAQTPTSRSARASAANGKTVFLRTGCPACHGTVGHGGAGPRLAPNPLPLAGFMTWVRNGTPGWTIASGMPAFPPEVVSDAELADVLAYLASVPAPPAADDLPQLKP